ncbi:UDP-N-acetylglucosamine 1-carboxyvinyltransferase [Candidatus Babeliales bacterium]|nr:UDP-N-acetylglucosamine 1-carboxyvinyltransferase [Candidatus Babeliales bacterium]
MNKEYLILQQSSNLQGTVNVSGAKNAVLVIIISLILTRGKSTLHHVPNSADVLILLHVLQKLGALVEFDTEDKILRVDTNSINSYAIEPEIMNKMRASILFMGPLLGRFGKAHVALPGGDLIGARPINYHLQGFKKLGVQITEKRPFIEACLQTEQSDQPVRIVLEYPSVGATENLIMFAAARAGETVIINAAIEPEVLDLIDVLKKMGANITCYPGLMIKIIGVATLNPITHAIIPDRIETGSLLLAAAITKGSIKLPNARADHLDMFLEKLKEMGHTVKTGTNPTDDYPLQGISLYACQNPRALSIKTGTYPGFPTDLQPLMMTALCLANGTSTIEETVFENRFIHVKELQKMGAEIAINGSVATIRRVDSFYGCEVIANDIRASCALALAGLVAVGETKMTGIYHWKRGYDQLEKKLAHLGANITLVEHEQQEIIVSMAPCLQTTQKPLE